MARDPLPNLEASPKPSSTLHNATQSYFLTGLPEEIRQQIYSYVLQEQQSQLVYIQTQMPGGYPEFRCTFIPEPVQHYLHARSSNPSLFFRELDSPSPYGSLHTYNVASIMTQIRQRLWNVPIICRKIYSETWQLGPCPCTFAFPSDLDLRLFLRELDTESRRHIGGLYINWRTLSSLMQRMPGVKTVYLLNGMSTPERDAETFEFYRRFARVVMVGDG